MRRILATDAGLTFFLVSLFVLLFVVYPLVEPRTAVGYVLDVFTMLVLVAGAYSVSDRRRLMYLAIGLAVVAIALHWLFFAFPARTILTLRIVSMMVFLVVICVALLLKVLRAGHITSHRVQGAVAVYLMMGLIWASAYGLVYLHDPTSFALSIPVDAAGDLSEVATAAMSQLVYFSFVTMTTLGYGDITPKSAAAGNLAIVQALTGQLYLAVILARLVSLAVARPPKDD